MQELSEYKTPDGWLTADVGISVEEWVAMLRNDSVIKPEYRKWLLRFYGEKEHQSSCLSLGKKFTIEPRVINAMMTNCGHAVQKHLKRFTIVSKEENENHFLTVLMQGRQGGKSGYQLRVKEELCDALHLYLIESLLDAFAEQVIPIGISEKGIDEIYKWQIVSDCQGKNDAQILQRLLGTNLIDNQFDGAAIKKLLQSETEDIAHCFSLLRGDVEDLQGRYDNFRKATDSLTGDRWKYKISDERMAGSFLACADPTHYTFYKNDAYTSLCNYLRITPKQPREKLCHFYSLLSELMTHYEKRSNLVAFFERETAGFVQSPPLCLQTIVWYMQEYMNKQVAPDTRYTWVPFMRELSEKILSYRDKRDELLSIFYGIGPELTRAYQEGGNNITDITPFTLLGTLAVGKTERRSQFASYYKEKFELKSAIPTDYTGLPSLHPQRVMFIFGANKADYTEPFWDLFAAALNGNDISKAFDAVMKIKGTNRNVSMGLFWMVPKSFLSLDSTSETYLKHYGFSSIPGKGKINSTYYKDLMEQVKTKMASGDIKEKDFLDFSANAYAFSNGYDNENEIDEVMEEYVTLLEDNYNLILTGAPGTGKTHLAKQMACKMILGKSDFSSLSNDERAFFDEHCKLVQFHPSYDYTDFVEGLRPENRGDNQIGFVRKDGVMKEICEAAILNWEESGKTKAEQEEDKDIKQVTLEFLEDALANSREFKTKTGRKFTISRIETSSFYVFAPEAGSSLVRVPLKDLFFLIGKKRPSKVTDIKGIVGRKRTQQYDSYLFSILEQVKFESGRKALLDSYLSGEDFIRRENFVLIIDEINRGELSKIFGELFFSIDPGYRGEKGRVQTQYQNLIEEDDVFYNGFYVPQNVYIIGTMNDIDRGVESMDFAIRRRFAWVDVKVEDRLDMLDDKIPEWSDAAKRCMNSLNAALEEKAIGLTSEYDIGPAYFLKLEQYDGDFEKLWKYHIKGVVTEYLRGTRGIDEKVSLLKEAFDAYKE